MKKVFFSMLLFVVLCSSCVKNNLTLDYSGIEPAVVIPDSNWPVSSFAITDSVFDATATSARINLYAAISFQVPLSSNLRIIFRNDTALVTEYNNLVSGGGPGGPTYIQLPDSAYQAPNLQLTIPKGSLQANIPITVFPNKMSTTESYMLAFTITDAQGYTIGTNFKSMIYALRVQ